MSASDALLDQLC